MKEGMLTMEGKTKWCMVAFAGYLGYKLFRYLSWKSIMLLSTGAVAGGLVESPR